MTTTLSDAQAIKLASEAYAVWALGMYGPTQFNWHSLSVLEQQAWVQVVKRMHSMWTAVREEPT